MSEIRNMMMGPAVMPMTNAINWFASRISVTYASNHLHRIVEEKESKLFLTFWWLAVARRKLNSAQFLNECDLTADDKYPISQTFWSERLRNDESTRNPSVTVRECMSVWAASIWCIIILRIIFIKCQSICFVSIIIYVCVYVYVKRRPAQPTVCPSETRKRQKKLFSFMFAVLSKQRNGSACKRSDHQYMKMRNRRARVACEYTYISTQNTIKFHFIHSSVASIVNNANYS